MEGVEGSRRKSFLCLENGLKNHKMLLEETQRLATVTQDVVELSGGMKNLPGEEVQRPMRDLYFDDIPLNQPVTTKEYVVPQKELIAFAKRWDPLPMHTDREAAKASPHGGLIAPATYVLAIASALTRQVAPRAVFIGGAEWKARFLQPVRPGDRLVATSECVHKRVSRTKADRGIVRFVATLQNQKEERVLELECTVVVSRRKHG